MSFCAEAPAKIDRRGRVDRRAIYDQPDNEAKVRWWLSDESGSTRNVAKGDSVTVTQTPYRGYTPWLVTPLEDVGPQTPDDWRNPNTASAAASYLVCPHSENSSSAPGVIFFLSENRDEKLLSLNYRPTINRGAGRVSGQGGQNSTLSCVTEVYHVYHHQVHRSHWPCHTFTL